MLLMLSAATLYAQGSDDVKIGGGGFFMGYGVQDISPLQVLLPADAPDLEHGQIIMGGMGFGSRGRLVFGGTGYAMIGDMQYHDSYSYEASGGFGLFNLGYIAAYTSHLRLIPMLGLGGGGYGLDILYTENLDLDQITEDPGYHLSVSNSVTVIDVGVQVYLFPEIKTGSSGGFTLALRAGYTYGITMDEWMHNAGYVSGIEQMDISSPYLTILFGFTGGW